ncbi:antirestriction protein [Paraburkholderia mimosarum]|uniref:antirestriction protein n=1 Tax=Paraburkholderia mimosarum TaxID=312026 RepID=UPI0003FA5DF3|nr:antirestriction protein [Paraburkholderia mimosarum]
MARAKITASAVPENRRMRFLVELFGERTFIRGEGLVFDWAARLSRDYDGGLWEFYKLSNGGAYVAPRRPERLRVSVALNGYEGAVSADAFGVVVTLFALNELANDLDMRERSEECDKIVDAYHALRDFALGHDEAPAILRAID